MYAVVMTISIRRTRPAPSVRVLFLGLMIALVPRGMDADSPVTRWTPARIFNGIPFLVRVTPTTPWKSLSGTFQERAVFFDRDESSGDWVGLAGAGFDLPAGSHLLALRAVPQSGPDLLFTVPIPVERALRPKSTLTVPRNFVEPNAKTRARIKRELAMKADLFSHVTPKRLFGNRFASPVNVATSEGYGVERVFNGKRQSVHLGLDYRAPAGTPVAAVANGRVVAARDFFFEGRFVAIDHGYGLMTLYLHLSRIDVQEGDVVMAGQRLGLSGASGRATGPHLHLAVRWQSLYLDPVTLLGLDASWKSLTE